jgi:hypothetical protein
VGQRLALHEPRDDEGAGRDERADDRRPQLRGHAPDGEEHDDRHGGLDRAAPTTERGEQLGAHDLLDGGRQLLVVPAALVPIPVLRARAAHDGRSS